MEYICSKCEKEFKSESKFLSHLQRKTLCYDIYVCPVCSMTYEDKLEFIEHRKTNCNPLDLYKKINENLEILLNSKFKYVTDILDNKLNLFGEHLNFKIDGLFRNNNKPRERKPERTKDRFGDRSMFRRSERPEEPDNSRRPGKSEIPEKTGESSKSSVRPDKHSGPEKVDKFDPDRPWRTKRSYKDRIEKTERSDNRYKSLENQEEDDEFRMIRQVKKPGVYSRDDLLELRAENNKKPRFNM